MKIDKETNVATLGPGDIAIIASTNTDSGPLTLFFPPIDGEGYGDTDISEDAILLGAIFSRLGKDPKWREEILEWMDKDFERVIGHPMPTRERANN